MISKWLGFNPFYPGTQLVRIRGYVRLKSMYVEIEAFPPSFVWFVTLK